MGGLIFPVYSADISDSNSDSNLYLEEYREDQSSMRCMHTDIEMDLSTPLVKLQLWYDGIPAWKHMDQFSIRIIISIAGIFDGANLWRKGSKTL